jgi:uncharacterized protein YgiM (DUF1202 family)
MRVPTTIWTFLVAVLTAGAPAALAQEPDTAPAPHVLTDRSVRLAHDDHNVVRTGPGDGFAIKGVYPKGLTFTVIAKSGDWYNIRLSDTETGWIHASLCEE